MNEEGTPTAKQIRKDEQAKQVQSPDTDMMSQDKDADMYIYITTDSGLGY